MTEAQLYSPAAARNAGPIASALVGFLPGSGTILEIAAGSGQHAAHFAPLFPDALWQPTDPSPEALASIAAYHEAAQLPNLLPPVALDVCEEHCPVEQAAAILAINLIHIAPWEATLGLSRVAARLLATGTPLVLYGPYFVEGRETAPSNLAFDESLRSRDARWGVRRLADVKAAMANASLAFEAIVPMPANNDLLVFRKR